MIKEFRASESRLMADEKLMREREMHASSLIERSAVATFVIDASHRVTHWNRACENLTGLGAADVLGTDGHWRAFYRKRRPCLADIAIDGNTGELSRYYEAHGPSDLAPDGLHSEGWVEVSGARRYICFDAAPVTGPDGRVVAAIETIEDITARKEAEDALRRSMDFVQAILDGIGDPTMVIDVQDHRIVLANRAAREAGGPAEGLPCYRLLHHRDSPCGGPGEPCPMEAVRASGAPARVTHAHFGPGGERRTVDIVATPLFDGEGRVWRVIESCRDITERVRAEEERERLIAELQGALAKIKTLKGLIPICAWCRKVRDDKGYWEQLESYVREHSDADFTHGICPDCVKKIEEEHEREKGGS
ncbi:MAG: hypothetical protein Kow0025_12390 [Thermodesulfovibrionales bacterium]